MNDSSRELHYAACMNHINTHYEYALDLLEDIVKATEPTQTVLIICATREAFLAQLLAQANQYQDEPATTNEPQDGTARQEEETRPATRNYQLLTPTLQLLSTSRFCNLVFCPTTTVLRGYLSNYNPRTVPSSLPVHASVGGRIVILDLLAAHHGTSEFTLQGLSQTLATAVTAAHRANRQLELVECKDIQDPSDPSRGPVLWQAEAQLLSGAIKIGEGGTSWGRRSISVRAIASRWFQIRRPIYEGRETEPGSHVHKRAESGDQMVL